MRIATVLDALGNEQASGYDPNGNVETFTTARGAATLSTYDQDTNHLMGVEQPTDSGSTLFATFAYDDSNNPYGPSEYTNTQGDDTNGNLVGITPEAPLGATSQTVDVLSRLASHTNGKGQTTFYGYDILDRVTQVTCLRRTAAVHRRVRCGPVRAGACGQPAGLGRRRRRAGRGDVGQPARCVGLDVRALAVRCGAHASG